MKHTRLIQLLFFIAIILSGFSYIDFAVTGMLLLIASVLVCRSTFKNNQFHAYSLTNLMLIYLIWLYVVSLTSAVPNTSMATLAILAGLPVMYLVASNMSNFAEIWKNLRIALFVIGVGLSLWAIWQVVNHIGYGYATGPLNDRNGFAALLNLLWFPSAYLFFSNKNKNWLMLLLTGTGLLTINIALFATASRGGVGTWFLLFPILLWAAYQYTKSSRLVGGLIVIALAAYLSSALLLNSSAIDRTVQLIKSSPSVIDASTSARLSIWKSTIKIASDNPIVGTGWGTFGSYYPPYRLPVENVSSGFFAHNDYLQFAAEGGFPALFILLCTLFALILQLKRNLKTATISLESVSLLLGLLALFIHAWVNFIFYFAFINIIAGLYFARVAQLSEKSRIVLLPDFAQIRPSIKRLFSVALIILIAAPFSLHVLTQFLLTGSKPGLKVVNLISPNLSAFDVANLITAIRPQEGIAQEYILRTDEYYLENYSSSHLAESEKRKLLIEALARFDSARARTANNPNIGIREVKILMEHHSVLETGAAYARANQILSENLKADPYHARSMILLARLQVLEGNRTLALDTLKIAEQRILSRRDQQLILLENLRQLAVPKVFSELDEIEEELHAVHTDSETGEASSKDVSFYDNIDARLNEIAGQISNLM